MITPEERERFDEWVEQCDTQTNAYLLEKEAEEIFIAGYRAAISTAASRPDINNKINGDEVDTLVNELDVLLNGTYDEAKHTTLRDLVSQVAAIKQRPPVA